MDSRLRRRPTAFLLTMADSSDGFLYKMNKTINYSGKMVE